MCVHLWIGEVGPILLAILRLGAACAATDAVSSVIPIGGLLDILASLAVYVLVVIWLFELESNDAILLAVITFTIKIIIGFILIAMLLS